MIRYELEFEHRQIWFWQKRRHLKEGWTIFTVGFGSSHHYWGDAVASHIRPTAEKRVSKTHDAAPDVFGQAVSA